MKRDDLPDDIKPLEQDLRDSVREGLILFEEKFGFSRSDMTVRSERSNIHDCIVGVAKRRFPDQYREIQGLFLLLLGNYAIKIKKLDPSLRTSSQMTQLVFSFLNQDSLFGPAVTHLHLGYVPDAISPRNSSVWLVCPDGERIEWSYEFPGGEKATSDPTTLAPTDPNSGSRPQVAAKKLQPTEVSDKSEKDKR